MAAAAAFIKSKMPMGQPDSLSDQDAIDVADFVAHQPRPVFAGAKPAGSAKGRCAGGLSRCGAAPAEHGVDEDGGAGDAEAEDEGDQKPVCRPAGIGKAGRRDLGHQH
jgi:hypothetical protein